MAPFDLPMIGTFGVFDLATAVLHLSTKLALLVFAPADVFVLLIAFTLLVPHHFSFDLPLSVDLVGLGRVDLLADLREWDFLLCLLL